MLNSAMLINDPLLAYQEILFVLSGLYKKRKEKFNSEDWTRFSNLLIDKFSIHGFSLFHIAKGPFTIGTLIPMDFSSFFTVYRSKLEAYLIFNNIFVSSSSEDEKFLKFKLWQLNSFYSKKKFKIEDADFPDYTFMRQTEEHEIEKMIQVINNNKLYNTFSDKDKSKLLKEKDANHLFSINLKGNVHSYNNMIDFAEKIGGIKNWNIYKFTSLHVHSSYMALIQFEEMRGKIVNNDYYNNFLKQAIFLTCFLIYDLCKIDSNVHNEFYKLDNNVINLVKAANNDRINNI